MELYLAGIGDEKDKPQAMSQQSTNPVNARKVDEKAIAELGKEREILDRVETYLCSHGKTLSAST